MPILVNVAIDPCTRLRMDRHDLLTAIADADAHNRDCPRVRKTIEAELQKIARDMEAAGCPQHPDDAEFADLMRKLEYERVGEEDEETN